MGCDIHMYVEYKRKFRDNVEKWVHGDYFKPNPHYDGIDEYESAFERMELYGDRNYSLFSTLAGVRDYTDQVIPVAEPKGVPDDCCEYIKEAEKDWDGDGHTHSWLTLKELKDYQATNPVMHYTGLISPYELKAFDENGTTPQSWCQGTSQEGYERRSWTEENTTLLPLIEKLQRRGHELLKYDWQKWEAEDDDKVRIVFWFDN